LQLVTHAHQFYFQFEVLNQFLGLWHAVTTRQGGKSHGPYAGFNLSDGVGDVNQSVMANRECLRVLTGGGVHLYARQNHGTSIHVIKGEEGHGRQTIETLPGVADAMITDVPGIFLLIQTADCQAVMIVDVRRHVVANAHCGWRGSVANILGVTIKRMVDQFGCDPGDMVAAIGPSLGPCCAEFVNYKEEIPPPLWPFRVAEHHFDFWQISRHQLIATGLSKAHIYSADICTRCNPHLFFSYRAQRQTGRFAALIGMIK
jgi:YfiH family protein